NDIATDSYKQPGSSFKSLVLATALENGFVPNDIIDGDPGMLPYDDPITNQVELKYQGNSKVPDTKQCTNFSVGEGGTSTLTSQTTHSVNCAFWRLGQIVGLEKVIDLAKKLGITNAFTNASPSDIAKTSPQNQVTVANFLNPWFPNMAFGGSFGVHAIDMASVYSTFANDGVHNEPYFVDKITNADGKVLYQHTAAPQPVMSPQSARLLTQVLKANVDGGTGTQARLSNGQDAAGKTGTTDEAKNLWFDGYTPQLTTVVWVGDGSDAEVPLFGGSAQGGQIPADTWGLFMNAWLRAYNVPNQDFTAPAPTRPGTYINTGPSDGDPFNPAAYNSGGYPGQGGPTYQTGPSGSSSPQSPQTPSSPQTTAAPATSAP
ncbi:MAG: penicillin-binding transpeptidase domain-containing protein, partial [Acidimicrobiales bacterium]